MDSLFSKSFKSGWKSELNYIISEKDYEQHKKIKRKFTFLKIISSLMIYMSKILVRINFTEEQVYLSSVNESEIEKNLHYCAC